MQTQYSKRYIHNFEPSTITTRTPRVPGMVNPRPEHWAAKGWREITEYEQPPEGHVATYRYEQHPNKPEACIARVESSEPEHASQTADDLQTYGTILGELLQRLAAFPGITPGMGYQQIADIMDAHVVGLSGEELARASVDIQRANNLYKRLENAGITGERFWRAVAALQQ